MYLKNNLCKIKNNFSDIYHKYQRFFKYIADKVKHSIDYELLSSEVADINFYYRYGTLYNYLDDLLKSDVERISIKSQLFLEDLSKGFMFKKVYAISRKNITNTEKTHNDLVLNDKKKLVMCFTKMQTNSLVKKIKIFFKKQKICLI